MGHARQMRDEVRAGIQELAHPTVLDAQLDKIAAVEQARLDRLVKTEAGIAKLNVDTNLAFDQVSNKFTELAKKLDTLAERVTNMEADIHDLDIALFQVNCNAKKHVRAMDAICVIVVVTALCLLLSL